MHLGRPFCLIRDCKETRLSPISGGRRPRKPQRRPSVIIWFDDTPGIAVWGYSNTNMSTSTGASALPWCGQPPGEAPFWSLYGMLGVLGVHWLNLWWMFYFRSIWTISFAVTLDDLFPSCIISHGLRSYTECLEDEGTLGRECRLQLLFGRGHVTSSRALSRFIDIRDFLRNTCYPLLHGTLSLPWSVDPMYLHSSALLGRNFNSKAIIPSIWSSSALLFGTELNSKTEWP